jgi:energy-coupling factor transporter ATP-binding protein EcfA2
VKLLSLAVEGVRGVPDGSYTFSSSATGAPLEVVLVTGAQDSGKTSLLEAVAAAKEAIGSYGPPPDAGRLLRKGKSRGRVTSAWFVTDAERTRCELQDARQTVAWEIGEGAPSVDAPPRLRRLFTAYSSDPGQGKFELFPANRSLRASEPLTRRPAAEAAEVRLRMTSSPDKYTGLRQHLAALALADAGRLAELLDTQGVALRARQPDALAPYKEAVAALLPDVRLLRVEPRDRSALVHFQHRNGVTVELCKLSESEQQAVLFATTFRRIGLNHSLVLIDTPELHIHPARHADFFTGLAALGRDNQLIAATTSPALLAAARPEQVIDLSKPRA